MTKDAPQIPVRVAIHARGSEAVARDNHRGIALQWTVHRENPVNHNKLVVKLHARAAWFPRISMRQPVFYAFADSVQFEPWRMRTSRSQPSS